MMSKCICSIAIKEGEEISVPTKQNPGKAKSFSIKRRMALFYQDSSGKYFIPETAIKITFPDYHEHMNNVNYGTPVYA